MFNFYLLFLLVLPLSGWVVLRTLLGIESVVYLLPFSFVLGLAMFLVLLYGLTCFVGVKCGVILGLIILVILLGFLLLIFKKDVFRIENPFKKHEIFILSGVCLVIFIFTFLITTKWILWDFKFHISASSYFAATDKFPLGSSNWPSLFIPYHYAFDLLASAITKLAGICVINSFQMIVLLSSVITFLSAFAIAYYFAGRFRAALSGALCFYFSGNLLWLDAIVRFLLKIPPVNQSWTFFQTMLSIGLHGSIITDLGSGGVLFASSCLGVPLLLLLLFLYLKLCQEKSVKIPYLTFIFLVAIALFHSAEWILYLFILALVVSSFVLFFTSKNFKESIINNLLCLVLFLFIILFCNISYRLLSKDYTYLPTFLELSPNPKLFALRAFGRFGNLNEHRDISLFSWDFISEFGLPFIFIIFVLYWLMKSKIKGSGLIFSFLLVSFISPFLLYIKSSPPDSIRLFHPGFELLSLFFALYILELKTKFNLQAIKYLAVSIVILPSVFIFVLSGIFSPAIYMIYPYIGFVDYSVKELIKDRNIGKFCKNINNAIVLLRNVSVIDLADVRISEYLKKHSKKDEYGLSSYPNPFDLMGIPCYFAGRGSSIARRITFITLLRTLDPYLFQELKIKWIYLEPKTLEFINFSLINELVQKEIIKKVFNVKSDIYGDGSLYEIDVVKYVSTYPRKAYWTFFVYAGQNPIPVSDGTGNKIVYLFKTEKDATVFLKEQLKINPEFKKYKPFVDAIDESTVREQAESNRLTVKLFS